MHSEAGQPEAHGTLRRMMETLGTHEVTVWVGSSDSGPPLRDVVLYDASLGLDAGAGDLLLAIGVDPRSDTAVHLVAEAGRSSVSAVAVRLSTEPPARLRRTAEEAGVALLTVSAETSWAAITSHLRAAIATAEPYPAVDTSPLPRDSLASLAGALAAAVNGSVLIFSPQQEVLASSRVSANDDPVRRQAVLDQHGPHWYRQVLRSRGVYRRLWGETSVVEVDGLPEQGAGRRLAIAVRAGDEILGSIWVAEGDSPLPEHAAATLREMAHPVALQVLRLRAQTESETRYFEGLGRRLLAGEGELELIARWLTLEPGLPCSVVTCGLANDHLERRLAELLTTHLRAYRMSAVAVPSQRRVDLIVGNLPSKPGAGIVPLVHSAVTNAADCLHETVLAGIGRQVPSLHDLPESRDDAELIVRALRQQPSPSTRAATFDDVRASAAVLTLTSLITATPRPELRTGPVMTLREHDQRKGTDYATSLRAYLDAFGDTAAAARSLHLHPNTLRYRLRRIEEISGLLLDDPEERLLAALQLRASPTTP